MEHVLDGSEHKRITASVIKKNYEHEDGESNLSL